MSWLLERLVVSTLCLSACTDLNDVVLGSDELDAEQPLAAPASADARTQESAAQDSAAAPPQALPDATITVVEEALDASVTPTLDAEWADAGANGSTCVLSLIDGSLPLRLDGSLPSLPWPDGSLDRLCCALEPWRCPPFTTP